ncbi:30S ribosomal protein S16 [Capronia coronata CBS 617.96]|uniref:30S ribosomal protein S16 n=1 Tax=Capronia coronata CBS 617.96 TaxID=1182541 RepID=W9XES1_9EURO|nr:30S ribosomal protein S16 [Capronia coronata CBS 617.96]EXJ78728.1 30S ribosomal protein S16 [Capronia coronata CBS 617.96]
MVLRIRLARFGTARKPVYNIILAQAKSARGKKPIEVLGTYNPIPQEPLATPDTPEFLPTGERFTSKKIKDVQLDMVRTKYWLGVGAQPTEPVEKLFSLIGLIEPKPSSKAQQPFRSTSSSSSTSTPTPTPTPEVATS